jgi:hypothetical protein
MASALSCCVIQSADENVFLRGQKVSIQVTKLVIISRKWEMLIKFPRRRVAVSFSNNASDSAGNPFNRNSSIFESDQSENIMDSRTVMRVHTLI